MGAFTYSSNMRTSLHVHPMVSLQEDRMSSHAPKRPGLALLHAPLGCRRAAAVRSSGRTSCDVRRVWTPRRLPKQGLPHGLSYDTHPELFPKSAHKPARHVITRCDTFKGKNSLRGACSQQSAATFLSSFSFVQINFQF